MLSTEIRVEEFLRQIPLFRELGEAEIARIGARTRQMHLARGSVLFHVGDTPTGFYHVVYGQVKLAFNSARGVEKVVELVAGGQSFGEAVMFVRRPYPVSAQTLADSMILYVEREIVLEELRREPEFAVKMIAGLSRRIHGLIADLEANSMRNGMERVIGFLLRDCNSAEGDDGALEIQLPVSKGVIASRLNITQEHFSRILHELSSRNLIEVVRRSIRVPSTERLRRYVA